MNSDYNKGSSGSLNNFNFEFGLCSSRPKSLNDQKNQTSYVYSSYSSSTPTTTQQKPAWQPGKPSWTHQLAPGQSALSDLNGPTSMVGDISGKSWNSTGPSSGAGIGIVQKNPNLFGNLVSSALGQGKGNSNVPLKNAGSTANKSAYSMGNMADSLPKTSNPVKIGGSWGSNNTFGSYSGGYSQNSSSFNVSGSVSNNNKSANLGGLSMKSMSGSGGGVGMGANKDPFGSFVDFGSKQQSGSINSASKANKAAPTDDPFGDFQNASKFNTAASKPSATSVPSSGFDAFNNDFIGSNMGSNSGMDGFCIANEKHPPAQSSGSDPIDMLFSSSSGGTAAGYAGAGGQQFSEVDDWGLGSEFGGGGEDAGGATTELEGLPPPPAGVTASAAKNKGMDSQKQGQYADAIKWLSWAVVLLEKTGDKTSTREALSCRASCYKEVGEYKKAVADCSKVLEDDSENVAALVQRTLLYESMEKYKFGAEDLRTVLKIDPINRIARSTIHRLTQLAD